MNNERKAIKEIVKIIKKTDSFEFVGLNIFLINEIKRVLEKYKLWRDDEQFNIKN